MLNRTKIHRFALNMTNRKTLTMESQNIDRKIYGGNYVATKNFTSNDVLASGKNPSKVYSKAIELGIKEPVINYIQKEGVVCLY
jgi:hypothetical protein